MFKSTNWPNGSPSLKEIVLVLVVAVCSLSARAEAVDFEPVEIQSSVGEIVSGYVDLAELPARALSSVKVQLASRSAYAANEVAYYSVHEYLRFKSSAATNSRIRIDLASIRPVYEPELNILLRITWSDELMLKGLTLSMPFAAAAGTATRTILTKPLDNLWQLAKSSRADAEVSIAQQMLAIQRINPAAFSQSNINGLKSGYLLRLPKFTEVIELDKDSALDLVESQHVLWGSSVAPNVPPAILGADLPPPELRGEVRIFEPTSDFDGSALTENFVDESNELTPAPVIEEISNYDNALEPIAQASETPVNLGQSVDEQIERLLAEERQDGYSAQIVWFIAGGILGVLVVIMLLRRQMAARRKNLEEAWVNESEEALIPEDDDMGDAVITEPDAESAVQIPSGPELVPNARFDNTLINDIEGAEDNDTENEAPAWEGAPEDVIATRPSEESSLTSPEQLRPEEEGFGVTLFDGLDLNAQPLENISNKEVYTTRLKLAEAYLEMDDEQGARDMLEEVALDGDDAQRALAKSIIQRIDQVIDDDLRS